MSDYRIVYSDELYHYGVPGMRWGHRKREAKTEYRRRLGASLDKYDKTIERIEKPYKRGQTLSKKDQERERKALNTQVREADKAKADYKKAKADIKAEKKEYKNDVKTLQKTLGVGDVSLYNDQGLMVGRVNSTSVAYNELSTRKGKEYADRALEKAKNKRYANIVGSTAVLLGASVALQMWADS